MIFEYAISRIKDIGPFNITSLIAQINYSEQHQFFDSNLFFYMVLIFINYSVILACIRVHFLRLAQPVV